MRTNTEHLMNALGWQGGTIHQLAKALGLTVETILFLGEKKILDVYQLEMYNSGYMWLVDGGKEDTIPKDKRGYPLFWLGVLDAQKNKKYLK